MPEGFWVIQCRQHLLSRLLHYHRPRKLNDRVRDGNGCGLPGMVTGKERPIRAVRDRPLKITG